MSFLPFFVAEISGPQQRWPRPLPGAILIPPPLLGAADYKNTVLTWCDPAFGRISQWHYAAVVYRGWKPLPQKQITRSS
jgi:hypothetical protein